jgi:hypothetical protein
LHISISLGLTTRKLLFLWWGVLLPWFFMFPVVLHRCMHIWCIHSLFQNYGKFLVRKVFIHLGIGLRVLPKWDATITDVVGAQQSRILLQCWWSWQNSSRIKSEYTR